MPIALTAKFDLLKRIESLSSSENVTDEESSLQFLVTPSPVIVHVSAVLTPFLRIVTLAVFPASGAGLMVNRSLVAAPLGIGSSTSDSIAAVAAPQGPKKVPFEALLVDVTPITAPPPVAPVAPVAPVKPIGP